MPTLPFKLTQDRRRHIPEQKRKVVNWREYDESLRRRGSLTVWFSDEVIEAWKASPRTGRGGQPEYSDLAILTGLTLKAVFRLAYRQTEGLIGSVIGLLGLDLAVPDHSTLCRRAETLEVPRPKPRGAGAGADDAAGGADGGAEPLHLLVDSTGLKLIGAGEWLVEKHGTKRRRSWRKMHLGVDADTGRIVAATLTRPRRGRRRPGRPLARPSRGAGRLRHGGRRLRPGPRLRRCGRAPSGRGRHRAPALDRRARRHGRDRADAAGPPPPAHCREGAHGVAESDGLQRSRPGRGGHLTLQTRDRGRAARAHRPAPRHRGQRRRPRAQPHAGAGTPGVRPHRLTPDGVGAGAPATPTRATQCRAMLRTPFRAHAQKSVGREWDCRPSGVEAFQGDRLWLQRIRTLSKTPSWIMCASTMCRSRSFWPTAFGSRAPWQGSTATRFCSFETGTPSSSTSTQSQPSCPVSRIEWLRSLTAKRPLKT